MGHRPVTSQGLSLRFRNYGSFEEAEPDWLRLEGAGSCHPFQRFMWLATWYETIGVAHGWIPAITGIEVEGKGLVALLPLGTVRSGCLVRLSWMGEGVSDYLGPLMSGGDCLTSGQFLEAIRSVAESRRCDYVELDRNPAEMPGGANPVIGPGFKPLHYKAYSMHLPESADRFIARRFSAKERYNLRRAEKLLTQRGVLEFRVASGASERRAVAERMIELKRARYCEIGAFDNFADPSFARFYLRLSECSDVGIHASSLVLDGRIIALHWGISSCNAMYYLMPTFEGGELAKYSPGVVFLSRFIDQCRLEGLTLLDFTIGDEPYKRKWCDHQMQLYRYRAPLKIAGVIPVLFGTLIDLLRSTPLRKTVADLRARARRQN